MVADLVALFCDLAQQLWPFYRVVADAEKRRLDPGDTQRCQDSLCRALVGAVVKGQRDPVSDIGPLHNTSTERHQIRKVLSNKAAADPTNDALCQLCCDHVASLASHPRRSTRTRYGITTP